MNAYRRQADRRMHGDMDIARNPGITFSRFLGPLAVACGLLSGCVTGPPPSPSQSICQPALEGVPDPSIKPRPSSDQPLLFPVRLTDDGEFVSRCELTDALQELRAPGAHLALIYIHGWKHDARATDSDRQHFAELLDSIDAGQARSSPRRRVVGVYISWNGQRSDVPVLNNLTFWGRKKAADLIAHSAITTKIFSTIDAIELKRKNADPANEDVTIYIGHSFGARMLYSAVSEILIHNVELAFPDTMLGRGAAEHNADVPNLQSYRSIAPVGDLVLLINPAFEASFYLAFQTLARPGGMTGAADDVQREKFAADQMPLLLTLSATNDSATGIAFPVGQTLALDGSKIRRTTLGNYAPAWTHTLAPKGVVEGALSAESWFDNFCSTSICLVRKPGIRQSGDPFIVAQATPSIIDGHNGIWGHSLNDFLVDFIGEIIRRRQMQAIHE